MKKWMLFVLIAIFSLNSASAQKVYLKLDGIKGEVGGAFKDWIQLESFVFDVKREFEGSGGKQGTQNVNIGIGELQPFVFTKEMDSTSPKIFSLSVKGNAVKNAEIQVTKSYTGGAQTYITYEFDQAFITNYHIECGNGKKPPKETITLWYNKVKVTYTSRNNAGAVIAQQTSTYGWDLVKNIAWD